MKQQDIEILAKALKWTLGNGDPCGASEYTDINAAYQWSDVEKIIAAVRQDERLINEKACDLRMEGLDNMYQNAIQKIREDERRKFAEWFIKRYSLLWDEKVIIQQYITDTEK